MSFLRKLSTSTRMVVAGGVMLLAAGAAATPAAYAGTNSQPTVASAKTVAVYVGNAATSGCIGHTEANADHNHEGLTFWYNSDGCIGTVRAVAYANVAHVCINTEEIRIYSGTTQVLKRVVRIGPFCDIKVVTSWSIHFRFRNPVTVCVKSHKTTGGYLGPACKRVN